MGYIKTVVISLIALCSFSASIAATAEIKIAVCDLRKAMFGSEAAQKRFEELAAESNLAKIKAKSEGIIADMQALKKDFDTNNLSWDDTRKAKAQREMSSYQSELQLLERDFNAEQQSVQQALLVELQPVAYEQVQIIIDQEKIDVLLKKEATMWNIGAIDITDKLMEMINKNATKPAK